MNIQNIQHRTKTLYAVIHALETARSIHFGNLDFLPDSLDKARSWITPECSFNSSIPDTAQKSKPPVVRADPNKDFERITQTLIAMFLQDLVNQLDSLMSDLLTARGLSAGVYPQSKIQKLAVGLDAKYAWSKNGCLELVAVRNSLVHNDGAWNEKSLNIIKGIVNPLPTEGSAIIIGFPMLFKYRKAVRTFINEAKKP